MRVLQIGKFYPIRGGVEKVMYDLMRTLSARGVYCDMLCATAEDHPGGTIVLNAYAKVMAIPTRLKVAATMLAPAMISRLRKIAPAYDIIHIHHPDPMACLALFLSGYKGRVIVHWHSDILKQKLLLTFYRPLQQWLIQRADLIVGTTPVYVKESEALKGVQHKVDFIAIGIDPMQADDAAVSAIKQRFAGKRIVFSLGRLVEYKGYEFLIRAAQHLPEDVHIVIGGKGPLEVALKQLIEMLGVQDRVTLIGFIADDELADYYSACDVFCLSSVMKTEAFAIVQIEAMSFAKPVISTRIPGSGVSWVNAHGESGLLADIRDPEALAAAILKSMAPGEYDLLSAGSYARYLKLFTSEKMVEKCLQLYKGLLASESK